MRSVTAWATLVVTGVAHHMRYRSDDRSWASRPGCAASASAMGATAMSMVMRSASMWRSIVSMSKRGCSRIHAPLSSAVTMLRRPRMWDGGVITCRRSAGEPQRAAPVPDRGGQRGMRVPNGFGHPGRARAEHQDRVRPGVGCLRWARRRAERLIQMKHRHRLGEHRLVAHGVRRPGQRKRVADLRLLPRGTEQHRRRPQAPDRPQRDNEFRPVRRHHGDPRRRTHSTPAEFGGHRRGQGVEVGEPVLPFPEGERHRLTHVAHALLVDGAERNTGCRGE